MGGEEDGVSGTGSGEFLGYFGVMAMGLAGAVGFGVFGAFNVQGFNAGGPAGAGDAGKGVDNDGVWGGRVGGGGGGGGEESGPGEREEGKQDAGGVAAGEGYEVGALQCFPVQFREAVDGLGAPLG